MKFTNKHGLPEQVVRALSYSSYDKGLSDYTPTSLIGPPRARILIEKHFDDIVIDVITRYDVFIGTCLHKGMEKGARPQDVVEQRVYFDVDIEGRVFKIGAQLDLYEPPERRLTDYKTANAYAFSKKVGAKKEWNAQLNIGALALKRNGCEVETLQIVGLIKNWDETLSVVDDEYPPCPIMVKKIALKSEEHTEEYVKQRILAHEIAKDELPLCTPTETWNGRRCAKWCEASSVCSQYKQQKGE